jgi:hypothetical protein
VIFVFSVAIAHMAVVTSLGLYYLMDRLYRRDREIVTPKGTLDTKPNAAAKISEKPDRYVRYYRASGACRDSRELTRFT